MATKKKAKKVKKPAKAPARKAVSQEVVIRVQGQDMPTVPTESQIVEPIHEGKKLAITPTWVSEKQIMRLVQKTPPEAVYTRPGKGGQKWTYVTGNYVEKVLNFVFGFLWDFEIVSHGVTGDFVWVQGKLTVKNAKGDMITKSQFGRAEIKYMKDKAHVPGNMLDFGNDLKAASTDALKKCASLLGIASDIYGKSEYKQETGQTPRPNAPQNRPNLAGAIAGPEGDPVFECSAGCGSVITPQEAEYSKKMYGKALCRGCQQTAKRR